MLRVDNQVSSTEDGRNGPVTKVLFPDDVLGPEEAAREGMSDAHIF